MCPLAWALAWGSSTLKGFDMKTTVSRYDFERAFIDADRKNTFTYDGMHLLFDYLEQYEEDSGTEIELDVIALCCEYDENAWQDIAENYDIDISLGYDSKAQKEIVREYLEENTQLVGETDSGFIYAIF
jgi:hypothetical protein